MYQALLHSRVVPVISSAAAILARSTRPTIQSAATQTATAITATMSTRRSHLGIRNFSRGRKVMTVETANANRKPQLDLITAETQRTLRSLDLAMCDASSL